MIRFITTTLSTRESTTVSYLPNTFPGRGLEIIANGKAIDSSLAFHLPKNKADQMASYNWQERLQAPWSPENTPPTFEVMPELPGAFPIDAEVSEARSPTEIFELPGSAIDNIPESNSRLSSLKVPFDERLPQYPVISQVEQLDSIPLQQPRDREAMADEMVRNRPSLTPKGGNSSVSESGKSTMAIVKDSSNPKSRKGSKTTTTPSTNDNVIAIFGLTGSGKSSFISKLTGKEVKIGHGLQSCE